MKKYDAIIIGFGKGGKTLAADLANHGWNVAVVERSTGMYGGTCINIGCIPTKALVHYAQVTGYRRPSTFEQHAEEFKQAILAKEKLTSLLREKNFKNLDDRETVTVYTGEASFRSPYEIVVKTDTDSFLLEGEKIFINAGATTIIPTISGIEDNPTYIQVLPLWNWRNCHGIWLLSEADISGWNSLPCSPVLGRR